jgi:predicted esterase
MKNINSITRKFNRILLVFPIFILLTSFQDDSHKSDLMHYRDSSGSLKPVKTKADWNIKRSQIIEGMELAMGKLPDRSNLPPFDMQVTEKKKFGNYTRMTVNFVAAENEARVTAYLYVPDMNGKEKKRPAMVVLHGTGDAGKKLVDVENAAANRGQASELASRGYVVIAPDYPSMGEQKDYDFANDRYESGTMKSVFNTMRCVDLLQSMKEVDPSRIGVMGHSLGGHSSMFAGAFDNRFKVIVSSSGWTQMDFYDIGEAGSKRYGGRLGPWAQDRYMPLLRTKFNLDPEKIPFDFDEVIAALAPRPFFSNSPLNDSNFDVKGVRIGIESSKRVYDFLNAGDMLQVRYPESGHDFPPQVRQEAYQFIDKILKHTPNPQEIK